MALQIQYDLFNPIPDEIDCLRLELLALKKSQDKMRRALFARENALSRLTLDMQERLALIDRNICRNI